MCWLAQRLQGPGADQGTVSFRAGLYFGNVGGNRQFTLVVNIRGAPRRREYIHEALLAVRI
jgi:hypothetical protein